MRTRQIRDYHVYIMTNRSYTTLYTGFSGCLDTRVSQHKRDPTGFAKQYRTSILVYYETTTDVWGAIVREKQIKTWTMPTRLPLSNRSTQAGWT